MPVARPVILALCVFALFKPALADEGVACLGKQEGQAVLQSGQVVPLKHAIAALPGRSADVVRARLCKTAKGYVYLLTLLARDGKVARVTVDAKNGVVISGL